MNYNNLTTHLSVPPNLSPEESGVYIINYVVGNVAPSFRFGYMEYEDIYQEARCIALSGINSGKYDESRPLEKFLYVHIRTRLINLQRDKSSHCKAPCFTCPFYDKLHTDATTGCGHPDYAIDKMLCSKYSHWKNAADSKRDIMKVAESPIDASTPARESDDIQYSELNELLETNLPPSVYRDYILVRDGSKIPDSRRITLQNEVTLILEEFDYAAPT